MIDYRECIVYKDEIEDILRNGYIEILRNKVKRHRNIIRMLYMRWRPYRVQRRTVICSIEWMNWESTSICR